MSLSHIPRYGLAHSPHNHPIAVVVDAFVCAVDSLVSVFPVLLESLNQTIATLAKELDKLVQERAILTERTSTSRTYDIPAAIGSEFEDLIRSMNRTSIATTIVPRSQLIALVAQYDTFLAQLIRCLYELRPELMGALCKSFSINDLSTHSSLEDAKNVVIADDIESIMRESHDDQRKRLESRFSITLPTASVVAWPCFIEVTERRNLFVHTNGKVSDQYLRVCGEHKVALTSVSKGQQLDVDVAYFENAYECIYQVAILLSQALWRKMRPEEQAQAEENLTNVCLNLLSQGRYRVAIALLRYFCDSGRPFSSNEAELVCRLNLAQAYKWSGNQQECDNIISSIDWSTCHDRFQLARELLYGNLDKAVDIVRRLGTEGVTAAHYRSWPIFRELRECEAFRTAFRDVFGEEFVITTAALSGTGSDVQLIEGSHSEESSPSLDTTRNDTFDDSSG